MSIQFSIGSVLEIAIKIEKNGRDFYRESAKLVSDEAVKRLFGELAEWEGTHIQRFQKMRDDLPEKEKDDAIFDPNDELQSYLEAAADSHVFVDSQVGRQLASQLSSSSAALDMALTFEKDSIVYFMTMGKAVSRQLGKEKTDALIDEEIKHIALLNGKKKELQIESR